MNAPSGELTRPRIAIEREAMPLGRPEWVPTVPQPAPPRRLQPRLALIVCATIAIVTGVIVALLLG